MNDSTKKAYLIAVLLTGVFTLLTAGFYVYALLAEYTPILGHFSQGAFSDVFLPLLYIVAVVVFIVFGFLFRESLTERKASATVPAIFASSFAALTTFCWLVSFAIFFFGNASLLLTAIFGALLLVLGGFTVAYLVLSLLPSASPSRIALFGTAPVLFCLVYAFYAYFDSAFALNSPIKIFDQITVIVLLFFFLAEGRVRFGAIRSAVYLPICMTAVLFSAADSLGGLIYMAVEGRPLFESVMHDFLFFGFFLYTMTRLISFLLPSLAEKPAESLDAPEAAPSFEASPAPGISHPAFEQTSFDFDNLGTTEEEAAPSAEDENEEDATEAALDIDRPDGE